MATLAQLFKSSWENRAKRKADEERLKNPFDRYLPFGLHDDGRIELSPFLPEGLKMPDLGKAHIIYASSQFNLGGMKGFRVFLHAEGDEEKKSYLWIIQDGDNFSIRWFASLHVDSPENDDDWFFWIHPETGMVGSPVFQTKGDKIQFGRLWSPGDTHVAPIHVEESVLMDRYDPTQSFVVKHDLMLYGRKPDVVPALDEYVLLSSVEDKDGSFIAIDVGVDISTADLKVIY